MNNKIILKITSSLLLCTIFAYTMPIYSFAKNETVYSKIGSDGSNYKTIVSTIENEEAKQEESKKELPVECKVKYELDGNEISAEELVGKSGKVKIKIEYINKDEHMVKINGKNEKMYTPFVVICGTIINNKNNKNIEITNGKVINDGSKTIVVGLALPGMQESLDISKDEIDIPNTVEITMDSKDFELNNIMTYATSKVFESEDLEIFDKIDEIYSQVNTLESSSKQLEDGANTLKEGANTFSEKSQEFNNAMNKVAEGTSTVNSNYTKIDDGISSLNSGSNDLKKGAEQLNNGIGELASNLNSMPQSVEALYNGSTDVLDGLNGNDTNPGLVDGVNSVISSLQETTVGLENALAGSSQGSQNAVDILRANNANLQSAINVLTSVDPENTAIAELTKQIAINNGAIAQYETAKETAEATKAQVEAKAQASVPSLTNLQAGMNSVKAGVTQINGGLGQLNQASGALTGAMAKLTSGSKALASGTRTLSTGANTLNSGSKELKAGISTLDSSTSQLLDANNQLTEGATTLADGMTKFNKEGIEKICQFINGNLKNVTTRVKELQTLSKEYKGFTELEKETDNDVKFIMVMDRIKKEETEE